MSEPTSDLYTDGGVVGRNPSPIGGTFAWRRIESGVVFASMCGSIRPSEIGVEAVSNNNAELLALLSGIEALPEGWSGRVNSDSGIALGWVFKGWSTELVPPVLLARLDALIASGKLLPLSWRLLGGHPTKADLASGIRAARPGKSALPCSEHNVACDKACGEKALQMKAAHAQWTDSPETGRSW